ncbi:hypothetical protein [Spirillospora albida]|uniref:hypothetical protein n=1 Tax=Spirillospora albida TaxID=58123 RepID=UPI0004C0D515|nr:hypothetical protein [Spirillospora albida]
MAEPASTHLDTLADALSSAPHLSVVRRFGQTPPTLEVTNTEVRDGRGWELLSGEIFVIERAGLWYVWAEGDRLAPVNELARAIEGVKASLTFTEAEGDNPRPASADTNDVMQGLAGWISTRKGACGLGGGSDVPQRPALQSRRAAGVDLAEIPAERGEST